jgi:LytR cell envelope-related transcriptional attenuator
VTTERPQSGMSGSLSVVRAAAVLILFVAAVAVLVAVGTRPSVNGAPVGAPTTTTPSTAPGTSTTTTAAGAASSSTTSTTSKHHGGSARSTTTTTVAPATVSVVVANATQTNGLAAHYSTVIGGSGWKMGTPVDASTSEPTSAVYYAPGFQQQAASIATAIGLKPSQVLPLTSVLPVSGVTGTDVVVVIGQDLSSSSTTTTVASS